MNAAIVCLGNELIGDDGFGIRVGRVLERLPLPDGVVVLIRPNVGLDLIELLEQYDQIILVDAMTSGRVPGTCVRLDPKDAASMASCPSCSHSLGIPEILQLVARMFPERADTAVKIVGVEAASIDQFGVGLSDPVKAALPEAVGAVLDDLGAGSDLKELGRVAAVAEIDVVVTLSDVVGG